MVTTLENVRGLKIKSIRPAGRSEVFDLTIEKNHNFLIGNGLVASNCHYQHGEDSIIEAVIGLAQDFAGSNNLPLLLKNGQFGMMSDYDSSEPRYIHVRLHQNLDTLFSKDDTPILPSQEYDNEPIEPKFFLPSLPVVLVNGSRGVGNGYSSRILCRNPRDVAEAIKLHLEDKPIPDKLLYPWFRGFKGEVEQTGLQYRIKGSARKVGKTKLKIDALPPDSTYQYESYKVRTLLKLLDTKVIRSFEDNSTEMEWDIEIEAPMEFINQAPDVLQTKLGLIWSVTENLNCWGWDDKLHMFKTPQELLAYWVEGRLEFMQLRIDSMIDRENDDLSWMKLKLRFILLVNGTPDWTRFAKPVLKKFVLDARLNDEAKSKMTDDEIYNRLMMLRVSSLTMEEVEALQKEIIESTNRIDTLRATTPKGMLLSDIRAMNL